jgi:pSer/pThr/pTyr-binding forkhead associated (FHA) protein
MRHAYLVDALWHGFEELATEYDCSVDYLLNEAMRLYLRSKRPAPVRSTPSPISSTGPGPRAPTPRPAAKSPPPRVPPRPPPVPLPPAPAPARVLVLGFHDQEIAITKDAFVIGRKQAGSDLVIKDGNISRHHAVILRRDGVHYLKDLGSTNGVTFQGERVQLKRIEEGDLFRICDYELRFSYRAAR